MQLVRANVFLNMQQVIPVIKQIDMFKEYARRIEVGVGKERAGELIKNALFVISAGTNDYVLNYYGPPIRSKTYTISAYHHFLLQIIHQFLQVRSLLYISMPTGYTNEIVSQNIIASQLADLNLAQKLKSAI